MTLEREVGDNEYILEQSVDGMELSACARFWCAPRVQAEVTALCSGVALCAVRHGVGHLLGSIRPPDDQVL